MCIREGRGPPALRARDVEEEPAEEGSQPAGGREAERWRPGVMEAAATTRKTSKEIWPGAWHFGGHLEESGFGVGEPDCSEVSGGGGGRGTGIWV